MYFDEQIYEILLGIYLKAQLQSRKNTHLQFYWILSRKSESAPASLYFYQQYMIVPIALYRHLHLFLLFFTLAILADYS